MSKSIDKSYWIIIPFVLLLHLLIGLFFSKYDREVSSFSKKRINVQTISLKSNSEEKITISSETKKNAPVIKTTQKLNPKSKEKNNSQPEIIKQTPKSIPKDVKSQNQKKIETVQKPKKSQEWIGLAKEKLVKIVPSSDSMSASLSSTVNDIASPLHIDNSELTFLDTSMSLNTKESFYRDELAQMLKLYLKLPEYGDVKIKLTVDREGNVTLLNIIASQSKKNAAFIEKNIPKLKFPPFGSNFKGVLSQDFIITLSNE